MVYREFSNDKKSYIERILRNVDIKGIKQSQTIKLLFSKNNKKIPFFESFKMVLFQVH